MSKHIDTATKCVYMCVCVCVCVCLCVCVFVCVGGWLHGNSTRGLRGEGESPSYWVTQSSGPILTFPLIALHLPNHVKWACMLTPHSVYSHTHTHAHTHTHIQEAEPLTEKHTHSHKSIKWTFPLTAGQQNKLKCGRCVILTVLQPSVTRVCLLGLDLDVGQ